MKDQHRAGCLAQNGALALYTVDLQESIPRVGGALQAPAAMLDRLQSYC